MSTFPGSPKLLKGGLVLIDPTTLAPRGAVVFQYSPHTITRTLQVQGAGAESGDRSEALRLKGPPVETIKIEAEIDATDQLEFPAQNPLVTRVGIAAQLAALETLIYPSSAQLIANAALALIGTIEIVPMQTPLAIVVLNKLRILPVRVNELSITEEAFDPDLNPIQAKVNLGLRVLSVSDLGFDHIGGNLFMIQLVQKEILGVAGSGALSALGNIGI
jgi:hypothetical protein